MACPLKDTIADIPRSSTCGGPTSLLTPSNFPNCEFNLTYFSLKELGPSGGVKQLNIRFIPFREDFSGVDCSSGVEEPVFVLKVGSTEYVRIVWAATYTIYVGGVKVYGPGVIISVILNHHFQAMGATIFFHDNL